MWLDARTEQTSILRLFIPGQRSSWKLPQCFGKDMWLDGRNEQTSILRLFIPEQRSFLGLPQCCLDTACPHLTGSRSHSTWPACAIIHSCTHLCVRLFTCSIICSCICSYAHACHPRIHSFVHASIDSFFPSTVHLCSDSVTQSSMHSFIHSVHGLTAMTHLVVLGCYLIIRHTKLTSP